MSLERGKEYSQKAQENAKVLWQEFYTYYRNVYGVPSFKNRQGDTFDECRHSGTFLSAGADCERLHLPPREYFQEMVSLYVDCGRILMPNFLLNRDLQDEVVNSFRINVEEQWGYQSKTLQETVARYLESHPEAEVEQALRAVLLSSDTPFSPWFRVLAAENPHPDVLKVYGGIAKTQIELHESLKSFAEKYANNALQAVLALPDGGTN